MTPTGLKIFLYAAPAYRQSPTSSGASKMSQTRLVYTNTT